MNRSAKIQPVLKSTGMSIVTCMPVWKHTKISDMEDRRNHQDANARQKMVIVGKRKKEYCEKMKDGDANAKLQYSSME